MTDKEAIEILKDDEIYITDSFYREFRTTIADKYTKAFETVLNLIQTQHEEIEILKQEKATAWEEYNNIDQYCDQEKQKHKEEIEKKDKIIDLMSWAMTHEEVPQDEYCICRNTDCEVVGGNRECKNCIKEYFINKVEKENKDG